MNFITKTHQLKAAIDILLKSQFITVDTEFCREATFWPKVCLIQIASPETAILIDPLERDIDLTPFAKLMSAKETLKVFHSARQDLEMIYHLTGLIPKPLFDTQIAAMVCGHGDSISYERLVFHITKHKINKSSCFTNWSQRPLSQQQINYALADVTHLREVYTSLRDTLQQSNRYSWLNEEINKLEEETYDLSPEEAWKKVKGRVHNPRELSVLQKIAAWREREAQKRNRPRSHILKDHTLIEIAIQQPRTRNQIRNLRTIPRIYKNSDHITDQLLKTIEEALKMKKEALPTLNRCSNYQEKKEKQSQVEIIKLLLKVVTTENNVATRIVATNDDITEIVIKREKADVLAMRGWRFDIFGSKALAILNGTIGIGVQNGTIKLFDIPHAAKEDLVQERGRGLLWTKY
ncbi:MAG: ribonuclease D [Candidatus Tokpelaia sp. JSC161]|jgi:ribonuclease D|nr:MAG: ribonuclease D [Candidatus Tokpelaia sp. JSC161]